jgi:hypothetical protein
MTQSVLPPCSVDGCGLAGGAIINDALLCGEHAAIEIERVLKGREAMLGEARPEADSFTRFNNEREGKHDRSSLSQTSCSAGS